MECVANRQETCQREYGEEITAASHQLLLP
jgi:hypothetical protein